MAEGSDSVSWMLSNQLRTASKQQQHEASDSNSKLKEAHNSSRNQKTAAPSKKQQQEASNSSRKQATAAASKQETALSK